MKSNVRMDIVLRKTGFVTVYPTVTMAQTKKAVVSYQTFLLVLKSKDDNK